MHSREEIINIISKSYREIFDDYLNYSSYYDKNKIFIIYTSSLENYSYLSFVYLNDKNNLIIDIQYRYSKNDDYVDLIILEIENYMDCDFIYNLIYDNVTFYTSFDSLFNNP